MVKSSVAHLFGRMAHARREADLPSTRNGGARASGLAGVGHRLLAISEDAAVASDHKAGERVALHDLRHVFINQIEQKDTEKVMPSGARRTLYPEHYSEKPDVVITSYTWRLEFPRPDRG